MSIPENLTLSIEGAVAGTQFLAAQVPLPTASRDLRSRVARGQRHQRADRRRPRVEGAGTVAETADAGEAAEGADEAPPKPNPITSGRTDPVVAEPLLVVGLGTPDGLRQDPAQPRFVVADILADRIGSGFKVHKRSGPSGDGQDRRQVVVLAKPRVY